MACFLSKEFYLLCQAWQVGLRRIPDNRRVNIISSLSIEHHLLLINIGADVGAYAVCADQVYLATEFLAQFLFQGYLAEESQGRSLGGRL